MSTTDPPQGDEAFRDVADHAPAILWMTDAAGACTYLNQEWYSFTGQTPAEALGFGWTLMVHPDDRAPATKIFLDALGRHAAFRLDYRLRGADGQYRAAIDVGRPLNDPAGDLIGYVGCVIDINDRKELERALLQSQKMEAVGRLAGGIAHDFNNLLTAISGHAHLIATELGSVSAFAEDLKAIDIAVQRAAGLTRQLLAFSRRQVLRPEILDLNAAVRAAQDMFSRIIGEDIELRIELADDLPPIRADRAQIDQVILNLVVNAREAMPTGGTLTITTTVSDVHGSGGAERGVFLAVRDTGVGMDDRTKELLFEPFFTTKPDGTGLGLATVYGIVRQSEGAISVESEPDKGATFTVSFPASRLQAPSAGPAPTPAPHGSGKILLVEDERPVRDIAVRTLGKCGYEVIAASNVSEALRKIAEHPDVRLIISDLVMPGGTGLDLAREVTGRGMPVRVMLMSGYARDDLLRNGSASEEYAFIQKPFTPGELADAVRGLMNR